MTEPPRQPYQLPRLGPVAGVAGIKGEPHDICAEKIKAAGWVVTSDKVRHDKESWKDCIRLVAVKGDRQIVVEKGSELGAWIELEYQIAPNGWR